MPTRKPKPASSGKDDPATETSFATQYPNIDGWVKDGRIEIGRDDYTKSFIRVMDEGGMIWEGRARYPSIEEALADADRAIAEWMENN
jgi:predicted phage gp36 major capsid-like protein